jgi:anti-anti-sigma regulatory factor/HAMP domain-containing protein
MRKVIAVVVLFFVVMIIAGSVVYANRVAINEMIGYLSTYTVQHTQLAGAYNTDMQRLIAEAATSVYRNDPEEEEEAEEAIERLEGYLAAMHALEAEFTHFAPGLEEDYADLLEQRAELLAAVRQDMVRTNRLNDVNRVAAVESIDEMLEGYEEQSEDLAREVAALQQRDLQAANALATVSMQNALYAIVGTFVTMGLLVLAGLWFLQRQVVQPLHTVSEASLAVTAGDLGQRVEVTNQDELGTLQGTFNQMVASLCEQRALLEERNAELSHEREALARAMEELRHASEERTTLLEGMVEQLSAPALPVLDGVLVMPLIGMLDAQRAARLQDTLLHAVEAQHARIVILDITGAQIADSQVASALMQTARAVGLLGARVVLTGIQPRMAETLVHLDVDMGTIVTRSTLQAGIGYALRS